jgi:hypothetical protein
MLRRSISSSVALATAQASARARIFGASASRSPGSSLFESSMPRMP